MASDTIFSFSLQHILRWPQIEELAEKLSQRDNVRGLVLAGSTVRGHVTSSSDIDLVVVVERLSDEPYFQIYDAPATIDVQEVEYGWLETGAQSGTVDLRTMRELERVINGFPVWTGRLDLEALKTCFRRVYLDPLDAYALLSKVERNLLFAAQAENPRERAWLLQSACYALCVFALTLTEMRFQKPKWLLEGLREFGFGSLASIAQSLTGGDLPLEDATSYIDKTGQLLRTSCEARGYPLLLRAPEVGYEYNYARRTYQDAVSLLEANRPDAAMLTVNFALRYFEALFLGAGDPDDGDPALGSTALPDLPWESRVDDTITQKLRMIGAAVQAEYKRRVRPRSQNATRSSALLDAVRLNDRIWVGAHLAEPWMAPLLGVGMVVLCASERQEFPKIEGVEVLRLPLEDKALSTETWHRVNALARQLAEKMAADHDKAVLVTCEQGINRGPLFAVMLCHHLTGSSGGDILERLRNRREGVLSNASFVRAIERIQATSSGV